MTDEIVGIDLGTTNSEIAIYRNGRPEVLADERGRIILPSVVALSETKPNWARPSVPLGYNKPEWVPRGQ